MRWFRCCFLGLVVVLAGTSVWAQSASQPPLISIVKKGSDKHIVSLTGLRATGPQGQLFAQTLQRNLELSGWFKVAPGGAVSVSGTLGESGHGMQSNCQISWSGKAFTWARASLGQAEVRRQAQQLSDEMVRLIAGETGFAQTRIVFINRRGSNDADLYMCDADGQALMQITKDKVAAVGPRWAPNGRDIYYTSFLKGYPAVYRMIAGKERKILADFKGLNTGASISPDGTRAAIILSYQGNPELYVMTLASGQLVRLTNTPHGSEASPCWSPDGRSIVYVSDTARTPQLFIVDVATKKSQRLTYKGAENVNPDWHPKGGIVYATKRSGGYQIATLNPQAGEGSAKMVTAPGDYEHPSWAADGRHIVCGHQGTLYILDTLGDPAVRLINIPGNWSSPDWSKR